MNKQQKNFLEDLCSEIETKFGLYATIVQSEPLKKEKNMCNQTICKCNKQNNNVWVLYSMETTLTSYDTHILGIFKTRELARDTQRKDLANMGYATFEDARNNRYHKILYRVEKIEVGQYYGDGHYQLPKNI